MTEPEKQQALRRRADTTFAGLLAVGVAVWALVLVLTGNLLLGLLYGLAPGVALAALGRLRVLRGHLVRFASSSDTGDRGRA